jgi:hypothetical protein
MSNVFCKRGKKDYYYKISAAYFNAVLKVTSERKASFFNYIPGEDYKIDGIIYPSSNTKAEGMNICLRKETVDNKSVECDWVAMTALQRNPTNQKDITFQPVSNEIIPDENGDLHFNGIW